MRRISTRSGPRVAGEWIGSIGETSLVAPCSACLASCARRGGCEEGFGLGGGGQWSARSTRAAAVAAGARDGQCVEGRFGSMACSGGSRAWVWCAAGQRGEASEASRCSGAQRVPVGGTLRRRVCAEHGSAPLLELRARVCAALAVLPVCMLVARGRGMSRG